MQITAKELRFNTSAIFERLEMGEEITVTYMKLVQGMRNAKELRTLKQSLREWEVKVVQLDSEISMQASMYVEEYYLSHSMQLADALIAATASRLGAGTTHDKRQAL